MSDKIKILVISHAFVIGVNRNRWMRLATDSRYEVHLLVPKIWRIEWFGREEKQTIYTGEFHRKNFHVYPLETTDTKNWGRYFFKSIDAHFRKIKPDLIYIIHEESILIHHQIYLYRKLFAPKAKIVFFSMNALGIPYQKSKNWLKRRLNKMMWDNIIQNTEAALVHYPGCLESLRSGGYDKPIFMQTQVGVDERLFAFNESVRKKYRENLKLDGKIVIGYSGRLVEDKGVDDLTEVFIELARKYENITLLLVGNGILKEWIEDRASRENVGERIIITGFVEQCDVPKYMNRMDIFVLGSKTMPNWIDTFPLVTVQAQSIGIPVVASNSGAIPWQLGDSGKIFCEGNRIELMNHLSEFIEDEKLRKKYGELGRKNSHDKFCHIGMTENFKKIMEQILSGEFIYHKPGEPYTQWKAY